MWSSLLLLPTIVLLSHPFIKAAAGWSWNPTSSSAVGVGGDKALLPRVSGQSTASINDKNKEGVLLFGGLLGAAGSPTTNDLWHFDCSANEWSKLSSPSDGDDDGPSSCPRVRMYAASAMLGKKFYIFGGWDPMEPGSGGEFLDDIWSFDWNTKKWSEEKAKLPYPVSRHAAATVEGVDGDGVVIIHTYKGILTFSKDGVLTEQPTNSKADVHVPGSLSMCAMTAIGNNKVVLFGGSDKNQKMSSEVYVLDTTNWTWTRLEKNQRKEDEPAAMASASMAPLAHDKCIVFGGAELAKTGYEGGYGLLPMDDTWICTIVSWEEKDVVVEWERIECDKRPEGRVAASLNCLGDGRFLLQGGYDPVSKETFDRPWILSTKDD